MRTLFWIRTFVSTPRNPANSALMNSLTYFQYLKLEVSRFGSKRDPLPVFYHCNFYPGTLVCMISLFPQSPWLHLHPRCKRETSENGAGCEDVSSLLVQTAFLLTTEVPKYPDCPAASIFNTGLSIPHPSSTCRVLPDALRNLGYPAGGWCTRAEAVRAMQDQTAVVFPISHDTFFWQML